MARVRRSVAPRDVTLRWIDVGGEHFALFEWPIHTSPVASTADPPVDAGAGHAASTHVARDTPPTDASGPADNLPTSGHATGSGRPTDRLANSEHGTGSGRPTSGHATSRRAEPSSRDAPRTADDGAAPRRAPDLSSLSPAERAVLAYVTRGDSNAQIAIARKTSTRTVANQVAKLLRKLGASSRFDLIRWFGRE